MGKPWESVPCLNTELGNKVKPLKPAEVRQALCQAGLSPIGDKNELLKNSLIIEQELLNETVGSQDQTSAVYGGFNQIEFATDGLITVSPINMKLTTKQELQSHLLLFFTGIQRTASEVASSYVQDLKKKGRTITVH